MRWRENTWKKKKITHTSWSNPKNTHRKKRHEKKTISHIAKKKIWNIIISLNCCCQFYVCDCICIFHIKSKVCFSWKEASVRAAPGHWVDQVYVSTEKKKPETPSARCHLPLYMQPSSGFMPHTAMKAWGWRKGAILPAKTMCPLLVRQRLLFTRTRKIRASLWPETESSFYRETYGLSCSCPSKDSFMQKPDEHLKTLEAKQTQKEDELQ